ncbi:hypothetical protein QCA50_015143 [Cerrena zonata]|uniref:Uncharacterized protein n=1 Tax=Cerrena zonata TaxID=2478898 RepID=A0AAW0FWQ1_9APHY
MLISALLSRVFQALLPAVRFSVLRGLGFGSAGPVKGSIAAWAQNFFFGAAVPEGSWFSLLQRAGMSLLRRDMEDYGDVENKILSELFSI